MHYEDSPIHLAGEDVGTNNYSITLVFAFVIT
jgi:hypothetical protein